jgi:hypothetical protein
MIVRRSQDPCVTGRSQEIRGRMPIQALCLDLSWTNELFPSRQQHQTVEPSSQSNPREFPLRLPQRRSNQLGRCQHEEEKIRKTPPLPHLRRTRHVRRRRLPLLQRPLPQDRPRQVGLRRLQNQLAHPRPRRPRRPGRLRRRPRQKRRLDDEVALRRPIQNEPAENPLGLDHRHLLRRRLRQARPRHLGLRRHRPALGRLRLHSSPIPPRTRCSSPSLILIALALALGIPAATIVARESGRKDPQIRRHRRSRRPGHRPALQPPTGATPSSPSSSFASSTSPSPSPSASLKTCPRAGASYFDDVAAGLYALGVASRIWISWIHPESSGHLSDRKRKEGPLFVLFTCLGRKMPAPAQSAAEVLPIPASTTSCPPPPFPSAKSS